MCSCVNEATIPSTPYFITPFKEIKYVVFVFNKKSDFEIVTELSVIPRIERNDFDWFWIALCIVCEFLRRMHIFNLNLFENCIKEFEMDFSHFRPYSQMQIILSGPVERLWS